MTFSISIITVVRNNLSGLEKTRRSIEAQETLQAFEWIVIDGASTDGTLEYLDGIPQRPSYTFFSEPDEGLYFAMNKGLRLARGEYAIFLNGGDTFAGSDTLQTIFTKGLVNGSPDLVYGDALEEDLASGAMLLKKARSSRAIWYGMFTHHQAIFYKVALATKHLYRTSFRIAGDYDFTARFISASKSHKYLDVPICIFEKGGLSEQLQSIGRRENAQIQREVLGHGTALIFLISAIYRASSLLRNRFSPIYRVLRYRVNR